MSKRKQPAPEFNAKVALEALKGEKTAIQTWMTFYNHLRPHSALGGKPPALVSWQKDDISQPDQQVQQVA